MTMRFLALSVVLLLSSNVLHAQAINPLPVKPIAADPKDTKIQALKKERFNALIETVTVEICLIQEGSRSPESSSINELLEAGLAVHAQAADQAAFLKDLLTVAVDLENHVIERVKQGIMRPYFLPPVKAQRIKIELEYWQTLETAKKAK